MCRRVGLGVVQPRGVIVQQPIERSQHCDWYPPLHPQRVEIALKLARCCADTPRVQTSRANMILRFLIPLFASTIVARLSSATLSAATSEGCARVRPEEEDQRTPQRHCADTMQQWTVYRCMHADSASRVASDTVLTRNYT